MRKLVLAVTVLVVATLVPVRAASAVDPISTGWFRHRVTVGGILGHARALQRIANRNGGNRAAGTPGYRASVDYVAGRLRTAGYEVTEQEVPFAYFQNLAEAELDQVTPASTSYATETFTYSGSGEVTGTLVPTNDVQIPATSPTSGCEPGDFVPASPSEPQVALIQRGTCLFADKVANAEAAGYDAVVFFNDGAPGRSELITSSVTPGTAVPVVGLSYADGAALYAATQAGPVVLRVATRTETDLDATTWNVIADTPGGDPDKVLVVGSHLDSVPAGPGINDDGSGVATTLEIAEELTEHRVRPRQKVRFAFFGAEELGLLGSYHYVEQLSDDELGDIFAYLNFDMLGSPNYVRFLYMGMFGAPGSEQLEDVFSRYFDSQGLVTSPLPFVGRSDYQAFREVGIPTGGLHSGAEFPKTPEQAEIYGGTAGVPFDPNYHRAGDDIDNLSTKALHELGDGAAHAVLTLARSTTGLYEDGSRAARRPMPARPQDRGHEPAR